jgi:hypothetical protein
VLSLGWAIFAVVLAAALTSWVTFTATRLDRLHARVDAAQAALDAQLVRRAAAVQRVAAVAAADLDPQLTAGLADGATAALAAGPAEREPTENALGRVANQLADVSPTLPASYSGDLHEVAESALRVIIARRFYNDAVRDTRALRSRRMARWLRLAGHRESPQFFDIDDATRWSPSVPLPGGHP